MKSIISLFVILYLISFVFADLPSGFLYGNPTFGNINFIFEDDSSTTEIFDTYVSRPNAICFNNNDQLYFSNTIPMMPPRISSTSTSGKEPTSLMYTTTVIPNGSIISSMRYDDTSNDLFYMFKEINPNRIPFGADTYDVIKRLLSNGTSETVYAINNTVVPTSFDIDTENKTVYISTNGVSFTGTMRKHGGIYKMNYDGSNFREVILIDLLTNPQNSISSIQYVDNYLYYIIANNNSSDIYKYHLNNSDIPGNSSDAILLYNSSIGGIYPQQIIAFENDDTDIWMRQDGNFYYCPDETFYDYPTIVGVNNGDEITDFDIDNNNGLIFYVGSTISAVMGVDISNNASTSIANGISTHTSIWADGVREMLYYSAYNRIDSLDSTSQWSNVALFSYSVDLLTGDSTSGDLIFYSESQKRINRIPFGSTTVITLQNVTTTAIYVHEGTLYYTSPSSTLETDINSCDIINCQTEIVQSVAETISSLSMDSEQLYYSTPTGIYQVGVSSSFLSYQKNIMPYALAYAQINSTLYFLDTQDGVHTIYSCIITDCSNTVSSIVTVNNPEYSYKYDLNGWMVVDSQGISLYWASSSLLGKIYQVGIIARSNDIFVNTTKEVTGLAISDDGSTLYYSTGRTLTGVSTGTGISAQSTYSPYYIGDIAVTGNSLLWSDTNNGDIYKCTTQGDITNSTLVDSGNPNCSPWQFITLDNSIVYNQYGCGGIIQASSDGSFSPTQLKPEDIDPIADLSVISSSNLIWALPYRYTILSGDIITNSNSTDIENISTFMSGTGTFSDLIVRDDKYYWINEEAETIMVGTQNLSPSDLIYAPAVALTFFEPLFVACPSPIPSASTSNSLSLSNTPSSTASISMKFNSTTPSASASKNGTLLPSNTTSAMPSATRTTTSSPTNVTVPTTSNSFSVSPSRSISPSPSVSLSSSPSVSSPNVSITITTYPSLTNTTSPSLTNTTSPSLTNTTSPSLTNTTTPMGNSTPTSSLTKYYTFSNTPSISTTPSFSNTPNIGVSPTPASPFISSTGWEWISVICAFILVLCVIPGLYFCWKRGVEREMAMSLRLDE